MPSNLSGGLNPASSGILQVVFWILEEGCQCRHKAQSLLAPEDHIGEFLLRVHLAFDGKRRLILHSLARPGSGDERDRDFGDRDISVSKGLCHPVEHHLRTWTSLNFVSQLVIGHLTYAEKCAPTEMSKAQALSSRFYLVGERNTDHSW